MTDIVKRLRAREGGGDDEEVLMREAADEIARLNAAHEQLRETYLQSAAENERLRAEIERFQKYPGMNRDD